MPDSLPAVRSDEVGLELASDVTLLGDAEPRARGR